MGSGRGGEVDETVIRAQLGRYFEHAGADVDHAEELYHPDAVLEFPQSGERFEGRDGFTAWRRQYPVGRDDLRYRIRRTTVRADFSVVELSASYDGGQTWVQGVQLLDWRDGKVARERVYVTEGWEAPPWRAPWRSAVPADPPG
ncbi:SnoaL-like domain-containing protein [Friedmanniella luteola]|uniref:SnoaL-like domain-containing protein n=1 Tax=Friedmanniella luteola TaxID=546871 RepID=A0A1H1Q2K2_9ACTN|nr:nuclear transport factor 2 family protein [Friedmanniella luteola]SDS17573.1 SnoaL-like domain-containing protein [Friedmanniella luteola]